MVHWLARHWQDRWKWPGHMAVVYVYWYWMYFGVQALRSCREGTRWRHCSVALSEAWWLVHASPLSVSGPCCQACLFVSGFLGLGVSYTAKACSSDHHSCTECLSDLSHINKVTCVAELHVIFFFFFTLFYAHYRAWCVWKSSQSQLYCEVCYISPGHNNNRRRHLS